MTIDTHMQSPAGNRVMQAGRDGAWKNNNLLHLHRYIADIGRRQHAKLGSWDGGGTAGAGINNCHCHRHSICVACPLHSIENLI